MEKNMIEERKKEMEMYFNIVGSGFGEEIDPKIKNNKIIDDYVMGLIDKETMGNLLIKEANKGI